MATQSPTLLTLACLALGCASTESRIIVAPDGSKALYVECKESAVECLAAISQECRGGYEVVAQSSREETLMLDKVTEAGTQAIASRYVSPNAKGIEATPSNIRQMLVRCGRSATASTDLKKLLDMPSATEATNVPMPPRAASPAVAAADDDDDEPVHETCPGADANLRRQRAAQWKSVLKVNKAGASQTGLSAELACNMARHLFLERCPEWSPYVPQVERAVCKIAKKEAEQAARVAKATTPAVVEPIELEESP